MELQSYAVSAKVAHHREPVLFGVALDSVSDVADKAIRLCRLHAQFKAFLCHTHKLFLLRRGFSDYEHAGGVGIVSVENRRHVDIDDVAFLEDFVLRRNAVANHLVNRRAHALREALIVERRRDGSMVDSVVINQFVDFRRAHSGMYFLFHEVEHSGVDFPLRRIPSICSGVFMSFGDGTRCPCS